MSGPRSCCLWENLASEELDQVGPRQSDQQMYCPQQVELCWVCECFHWLYPSYAMDSNVLV